MAFGAVNANAAGHALSARQFHRHESACGDVVAGIQGGFLVGNRHRDHVRAVEEEGAGPAAVAHLEGQEPMRLGVEQIAYTFGPLVPRDTAGGKDAALHDLAVGKG